MTTPPDPFRQIDALAGTYAEKYAAFTGAGIPPVAVAVMLGAEMGVLLAILGGNDAQQGGGNAP